MKRHRTVDEYIEAAEHWAPELVKLRTILLATDLEEAVKWGSPVYTYDGKNVVGIGGFQSYFGLWFFQGALLADPKKVLINAQEGRTKALRQWRLQSAREIDARSIKAYVKEAIELVREGVEIKPTRKKAIEIPPALQAALRTRKKAKAGYEALTPGRRREYADYVASAKQEATRKRRVEKILPMLEAGVGLNDRYRG